MLWWQGRESGKSCSSDKAFCNRNDRGGHSAVGCDGEVKMGHKQLHIAVHFTRVMSQSCENCMCDHYSSPNDNFYCDSCTD